MSLGGSLLLKRKGKSVILCGTAGAGFPVALGAWFTRAGVGRCELSALPVVFYWPVRRNLQEKEKKEKQKKLTGWQKIQLTWLKDKTTRNIHDRTP